MENDEDINVHFKIVIITFLVLLPINFFLTTIDLPYGKGKVTLGSLLILIYGLYLVYVISLYFKKVTSLWQNNLPWKKLLGRLYLRLLLFCFLITLITLFSYVSGIIWQGINSPSLSWAFSLKMVLNGVIMFFVPYFLFAGLSIVFPLSLYTLFLSIKSLIHAGKENRPYKFGIILLITSVILLILSFPALVIIIQFWSTGGTIISGRF
jgi:hypothetical protein